MNARPQKEDLNWGMKASFTILQETQNIPYYTAATHNIPSGTLQLLEPRLLRHVRQDFAESSGTWTFREQFPTSCTI